MDQWSRARFKSLFWPHWLDCFWSCCKRSGQDHRDCNIIDQFLWGYVHSYQTHLTYNNDKPWFNTKLRQLRQAKEDVYRKGDKVSKQAKYTLEKEIRVAKRNYSGKLRNKSSSSDSAPVWKGRKDIASYKTPSPSTVENQQLADDLNEFYCRFEITPFTPPSSCSIWTDQGLLWGSCLWTSAPLLTP